MASPYRTTLVARWAAREEGTLLVTPPSTPASRSRRGTATPVKALLSCPISFAVARTVELTANLAWLSVMPSSRFFTYFCTTAICFW
jgi:hypothetical protein